MLHRSSVFASLDCYIQSKYVLKVNNLVILPLAQTWSCTIVRKQWHHFTTRGSREPQKLFNVLKTLLFWRKENFYCFYLPRHFPPSNNPETFFWLKAGPTSAYLCKGEENVSGKRLFPLPLSRADFCKSWAPILIHTGVGSCLIAEGPLQCLSLISDLPPGPRYSGPLSSKIWTVQVCLCVDLKINKCFKCIFSSLWISLAYFIIICVIYKMC